MLTRLFGGLVLFLLAVVIASGLLLTLHYKPSTARSPGFEPYMEGSLAWNSVEQQIMNEVEFGSLIRSIHSIGVGLLFASLGLFLGSIVVSRGQFGAAPRRGGGRQGGRPVRGTGPPPGVGRPGGRPVRGERGDHRGAREWILGVLLGILLLGSAFTGSILPWDIRSFAAAEVAAGTVENSIPLLGQYCAAILRGGDSVGEATLRRAYVLHIAWLPIAIAILIFITAPWKWKASTSAVVTRDSTRTLWYAAGTALALVAIAIETGWLILKDPIIPLAVVTILVSLTGLLLLAIPPQAGKRPVAEIWGHLLCWLLATGAFVTMATVNPPNRLIPMVLDMPTTHNTESLHPEWYLMFGYGALQSLSSSGALLMLTAVALLMLLSPSLEKRFGDGRGKIFRLAGIVSFGVLVVLTVWGLLIPSGISLRSLPPPL